MDCYGALLTVFIVIDASRKRRYSQLLSYEQLQFKDSGLYGSNDDEPDSSG